MDYLVLLKVQILNAKYNGIKKQVNLKKLTCLTNYYKMKNF